MLESTGGMTIPLYPDRGGSQNLRNADGSPAAEFPEPLLRDVPAGTGPPLSGRAVALGGSIAPSRRSIR